MSNHTIDEKAFQEAIEALKSSDADELHYDIMHSSSGTEGERAALANDAVLRIFLESYLKFKG